MPNPLPNKSKHSETILAKEKGAWMNLNTLPVKTIPQPPVDLKKNIMDFGMQVADLKGQYLSGSKLSQWQEWWTSISRRYRTHDTCDRKSCIGLDNLNGSAGSNASEFQWKRNGEQGFSQHQSWAQSHREDFTIQRICMHVCMYVCIYIYAYMHVCMMHVMYWFQLELETGLAESGLQ